MPTGRRARECEICHANYKPTYKTQRTCSRACGLSLKRTITLTQPAKRPAEPRQIEMRITDCTQCGKPFATMGPKQAICSLDCRRARTNDQMKAGYHDGRYRDSLLKAAYNRRARLAAVSDIAEDIRLSVVAERDGWICGICQRAVPKQVKGNDRSMMASLDHIRAVVHGGTHTYDNVQLAHYRCNLSKGAGPRWPARTTTNPTTATTE
jgi:5-methylcytosine-specific restriction endonuclease McrA